MSKSKSYLTTRLLDEPARIGPFFFREFKKIAVFSFASDWIIVFFSLFVSMPLSAFFIAPSATLLIAVIIRRILRDQIFSPWYLELWVSRKLVRPNKLQPKVEKLPGKMVRLITPHKQKNSEKNFFQ